MAKGKWKPYDHETAERICELVSEGKSIVDCAQMKGIPSRTVIYKWLDENEEFKGMYARAREQRADFYADELLNIADNADESNYNVARLKIDTRKWVASKLHAKRYGDSKTIKGDENEPVAVIDLTPAKQAFLAAIAQDDDTGEAGGNP